MEGRPPPLSDYLPLLANVANTVPPLPSPDQSRPLENRLGGSSDSDESDPAKQQGLGSQTGTENGLSALDRIGAALENIANIQGPPAQQQSKCIVCGYSNESSRAVLRNGVCVSCRPTGSKSLLVWLGLSQSGEAQWQCRNEKCKKILLAKSGLHVCEL